MTLPNSPLSFCQADQCANAPVVKIVGLGVVCRDHYEILVRGMSLYTRSGWQFYLPGVSFLDKKYESPYPEFPPIVDLSEPDPYIGG